MSKRVISNYGKRVILSTFVSVVLLNLLISLPMYFVYLDGSRPFKAFLGITVGLNSVCLFLIVAAYIMFFGKEKTGRKKGICSKAKINKIHIDRFSCFAKFELEVNWNGESKDTFIFFGLEHPFVKIDQDVGDEIDVILWDDFGNLKALSANHTFHVLEEKKI